MKFIQKVLATIFAVQVVCILVLAGVRTTAYPDENPLPSPEEKRDTPDEIPLSVASTETGDHIIPALRMECRNVAEIFVRAFDKATTMEGRTQALRELLIDRPGQAREALGLQRPTTEEGNPIWIREKISIDW